MMFDEDSVPSKIHKVAVFFPAVFDRGRCVERMSLAMVRIEYFGERG
jgi:hypothetical protein